MAAGVGRRYYFNYSGADYTEDVYFYFSNQYEDSIEEVFLSSSKCEVNGVSLDKDRTGIIAALGEPLYEGETPYGEYSMEYIIWDNPYGGFPVMISISLSDRSSNASYIDIKPYSDGLGDDDEYDYSGSDSGQNQGGGGNSQSDGTYSLTNTDKVKSSYGNVYKAPLDLITSERVQFVNISNPEKVKYGCKIQITSGRNAWGGYDTYDIDEDGKPGGTTYTVVDATVVG